MADRQYNVSLGFTANVSQAKQQIADLQKQLDSLTQSALSKTGGLGLTKDIQAAASEVNDLSVRLASAVNKSGNLDLGKFNESLKNGNKTLSDYATSLNKLGPKGREAFAQLTQSITTAEVPLKRTTGLLSNFLVTLKNTAKWQISSTILHGFMGSLSSALGYAKDLNESLNNIRIVTGKSTEEMAEYATYANKAAKELSTTTTAYTNSSLIFAQQGLSDKEIKERTNAVIKMTNVTKDSETEVASYMTAIWNNFAGEKEKLEDYADVITSLGAHTSSSSAEIAGGLEKFASIGQQIGLSYDYAATALATIVAKTRQSEDVVGTALKTIFARIQGLNLGETLDDDTDLNKYSQALAAVGVQIKTTSGDIKDMDVILDELGNKWNTLAKDQQIALAQTVAGTRQYTQLIALMDSWNDKFKTNLSYAQNSEGTLEEQAAIYAEGWEAASKRVKASLQTIYQELLDDKMFVTALNGVEKVTTAVGNLIKNLGGLKTLFPGIIALITSAFGSNISNSINNFFYNIKLGSEVGRAELVKLRQESVNLLSSFKTTEEGLVGKAQSLVYGSAGDISKGIESSGNLGLQEKLLAKTEALRAVKSDLTEDERKIGQLLLDQNKTLGDQYIQLIKNKEAQSQSLQDQQKNLQFQFKISAGLTQRKTGISSEELIRQNEKFAKLISLYSKYQTQLTVVTAAQRRFESAIKSCGQKGPEEIQKIIDRIKEYKASLEESGTDASIMKRLGLDGDISSKFSSFQDLDNWLKELDNSINAINGANSNADGLVWFSEKLEALASDANLADFPSKLGQIESSATKLGNQIETAGIKVSNFKNHTQEAGKQIDEFKGKIPTMAEGITSVVSAASSYATALNMLSNASDTLFNPDTSVLQKAVTIIMSLSMSIRALNTIQEAATTIQEAYNAAKEKGNFQTTKAIIKEKARNVIGLFKIKTKKAEAAAENSDTTATAANTVATDANTGAVERNSTAVMAHPILGALAIALMTTVTIISIVSSAIDANTEKLKENATATKEVADEKQTEIDANTELIDSYDELLRAYKTDSSGKEDLEEASKKLVEQYEIEGGMLDILSGKYDNLTEKIKRARAEELASAQGDFASSLNAQAAVFNDTISQESKKSSTENYKKDSKYSKSFGYSKKSENADQISKVINDFVKDSQYGNVFDYKNLSNQIGFQGNGTPEDFIGIYEEIQELRNNLAVELGDASEDDEFFTSLTEYLEERKELYTNYSDALKASENNKYERQILNTEEEMGQRSEDITNLEEYVNYREELLKRLAEKNGFVDESGNIDETSAAYQRLVDTVDDLLSKTFGLDTFQSINEALESVSETIERINNKDIKELYNSLTEEEQAVFFQVDFDQVKSLNNFDEQLKILQNEAKQAQLSVDIQTTKDAASNLKEAMSVSDYESFETSSGIDWGSEKQNIIDYNEFLRMSYQEQVDYLNNLKISQMAELSSVIQENIESDKKDIEEYEEAIAHWRDEMATAMNDPLLEDSAITEYLTYCEEQIRKYHDLISTEQEAIEENQNKLKISQGELISTVLSDVTTIDELKAAWEDLNEATSGSADTNNYDKLSDKLIELAESYDNCSDEIQNYKNALQTGNKATIKAAEETLKNSTSIGEMAKKYSLNAKEVENYAKRLSKSLGLTEQEANRVATANMRLDKGVENLNKNLEDYRKKITEANRGTAEWSTSLDSLKEDLADITGISDFNSLSDDFALAALNSDDLTRALDGNGDAILRLKALAAEDIVANIQSNAGVTQQDFANVQAAWAEVKDFIESNDINSPTVDQSNLINSFNEMIRNGKMTKEQIEDIMAGLNVSADINTTYVSQPVQVPIITTEEWSEDIPGGHYEWYYDEGEKIPKKITYPATRKRSKTWQSGTATETGYVPVYSIKGNKSGTSNITTAFKKLPTPKVSNSVTSSGSGGSGSGGSGGGGGSGSTPSQVSDLDSWDAEAEKVKDKETLIIDNEIDRYRQVELVLNNIITDLEKMGNVKDKVYGPAHVKAIENETAALYKQKQLLEKDGGVIKTAKRYLDQDNAALAQTSNGRSAVAPQFDATTGQLMNYEEYARSMYQWKNDKIEEFNNTAGAAMKAAAATYNAAIAKWNEDQAAWQRDQENYNQRQESGGTVTEAEKEALEKRKEALEERKTQIEDDYKAAQDAYSEAQENFTEQVEDAFEDFQDALDRQGESWEKYQESVKTYLDTVLEIIDKRMEAIAYKLDLNLQVRSDEVKWLDWQLTKLGDSAFTAAEKIDLYTNKFLSNNKKIEDVEDTIKDIFTLAKDLTNEGNSIDDAAAMAESIGLTETAALLQGIASGTSIIPTGQENLYYTDSDGQKHYMYGGFLDPNGEYDPETGYAQTLDNLSFTTEMVEKLQELSGELYDSLEQMLELRKNIEAEVSASVEECTAKIDKASSKISSYTSVLQHYRNILDLSGKSIRDYTAALEINNAIVETSIDNVSIAKDKLDVLQSAYDEASYHLSEAIAADDAEMIEFWENEKETLYQEMLEAKEALESTFEDALQSAANIFEDKISVILENFEQSIANAENGVYSIDQMQTLLNRAQTQKNNYLADYEKLYDLNKLQRQLNQEMSKQNSNNSAVAKLVKFQEELNDYKADGVKMSEYEMNYLKAKYDLTLAQIALEDAQNAKNQVQLKRDSEGNYGYVYTADQAAIDEASQTYEDKLYNLEKLSEEYVENLEKKLVENYSNMMSALSAINRDDYETETDYLNALEETAAWYYEQDAYYRSQLGIAMKDTNELYNETKVTYQDLTISQLENGASLEEAHNNLRDVADAAMLEMSQAFKEWQEQVSRSYEAAGKDQSTYVNNTLKDVANIRQETARLASDMQTNSQKFIGYISNIMTKVSTWQLQYNTKISSMIDQTEALIKVIERLNRVMAGKNYDAGTDYSILMEDIAQTSGIESEEYQKAAELREEKRVGEGISQEAAGYTNEELTQFLSNGWTREFFGAKYFKDINSDVFKLAMAHKMSDFTEEELAILKTGKIPSAYAKDESIQGAYDNTFSTNYAQEAEDAYFSGDTKKAQQLLATRSIKMRDQGLDGDFISSDKLWGLFQNGWKLSDFGDTTGKGWEGVLAEAIEFALRYQKTSENSGMPKSLNNPSAATDDTDYSLLMEKYYGVDEEAYEAAKYARELKKIKQHLTGWRETGEIETFLKNGWRLQQFRDALKDPYLGFSSIPSAVWEKLMNTKYSKDMLNRFIQQFDTGGYTGEWGPNGKFAILHEKELVLNQNDTTNLLASVGLLRDLINKMSAQDFSTQLDSLVSTKLMMPTETSSELLEQSVHIEASFPGVSDRNEIEEAFNNLINTAAQYANRKR